MKKAASVDAYLADLPKDQRAALEKLRKQILAAAPEAEERISYGMPAFFQGRVLVYMAAFKDHLSFFAGSSGVTLALEEELRGFTTTKGSIHFTPQKPIPAGLVKRIVKMRVAENESGAPRTAKRAITSGSPSRSPRASGAGSPSSRSRPPRSRSRAGHAARDSRA